MLKTFSSQDIKLLNQNLVRIGWENKTVNISNVSNLKETDGMTLETLCAL